MRVLLAALAAMLLSTSASLAECLSYSEPAIFEGTVVEITFPETMGGDLSGPTETVFALKLDKPVCVSEGDEFQPGFDDVDMVQLFCERVGGIERDKHMRLIGDIFAGHTWHHRTSIVLKCPSDNAKVEYQGMGYEITMPNAKWSEAPELAPIQVFYLPDATLKQRCSAFVGFHEFVGCALQMSGKCTIYINDALSAEAKKSVLIHEDAHCRGWPGDHPVN